MNDDPASPPKGVPKEGESADPELPQPEAAEVESARLLANEARDVLRARGMTDDDIDRLAAAYVAEGYTGTVGDFVVWAVAAEPTDAPA